MYNKRIAAIACTPTVMVVHILRHREQLIEIAILSLGIGNDIDYRIHLGL